MRAMFRTPSSFLVVSLSMGTGAIIAQAQVHCSFLTRSRPNTVEHSCTRKTVFSFSKDVDVAFFDTWRELRCRSRVTDADWSTSVGRCGGTDASPPCNPQRSRHYWPSRAGSAQSDTFPEPALLQSVRRISRTRLSTWRTVGNRRSGSTTSVWRRLHGGRRHSADDVFPRENRYLFWSHQSDDGARLWTRCKKNRIDDCWNVNSSIHLSDSWKRDSQNSFYWKRLPKGYMWSRERLTNVQATSRPDNVFPDVWTKIGKATQKREQQEWANEKPKLDNARRLRRIYFIDPGDEEYQEII